MADQTPPNDPLDNRLRATFNAERDDIERRYVADGAAPARSRSLKWIPFAVAAAVIAIAGFAFIGNRSSDQAVDLDVAAQDSDDQAPDNQTPDGPPAPTDIPVPVDASGQPVLVDENGQPLSTPVGRPDVDGMPVPHIAGENMCGDLFDPELVMVVGNGAAALAAAQPETSGEVGITRTIPSGTGVVLAGGCTRAETSGGVLQWYEINGTAGQPNDWILSNYLVRQPRTGPAPAANECGVNVPLDPHFVWGIPAEDPDGGLVAHTVAGVNEPITRVLMPSEIVLPSRGCVLTANGSAWYQILGPFGFDWVNARYLRVAEPACIVGEQYGTIERNGPSPTAELVLHTVRSGDDVGSIASHYDVAVDVIITANPNVDTNTLELASQLRVPTISESPQLIGPVDGWAVVDGDDTAYAPAYSSENVSFLAPLETVRYRWYPADGVAVGSTCFQDNLPVGPVCLTGDIRLIDLQSAEPIWSEEGSVNAWLTGRGIAPPQTARGIELIEVELTVSSSEQRAGLVDPREVDVSDGQCTLTTGSDTLAAQRCMRVASPVTSSSSDPLEYGPWYGGDTSSDADHIHDIRTESNDICTRVVITFGENANVDDLDLPPGGSVDGPAATLPPFVLNQDLGFVRITSAGWDLESAFMDPTRIDYPGGIGLLTLSPGYEFAVELMHTEMEPNARFLEDPARIVIDLFPIDDPDPALAGPFGDRFVLRQPIQIDMTGPGIPVGNDIVVEGFGRPFEAAGLYRIWAVTGDVDPDAFLADPPAPLIEEFFPTGGWAEGWGTFSIDLPDLEPGSYIAVFGELPPTDEIGFYGTGQLFRVANPDDPTELAYPPAVLLPNVQLPPE